MGKRILLVEDDPAVIDILKLHLEQNGFALDVADDGQGGLDKVRSAEYVAAIVDWNLPGMDGLEFCRQLRQEDDLLPVLMLTARSEEVDRIVGLEVGADDYVVKPFSPREIIARVKALLRRAGKQQRTADDREIIKFHIGDIELDLEAHTVSVRGKSVRLTAKEFELLAFFMENVGRVFTRDELLQEVWGYSSSYERVITTFVSRVRSKIEEDPESPRYLLTVRGVGYKFARDEELQASE